MLVELTQGKCAVIDKDDLKLIANFKWCVTRNSTQDYAKAYVDGGRKNPRFIYLHHLIVGKPKKGFVIDHINGNGLDNRRKNLRVISHRENTLGKKILRSDNKSGFTGISWNKRDRKWRAQIKTLEGSKNLGSFEKKSDAIKARKSAAKKYYGIYAKL